MILQTSLGAIIYQGDLDRGLEGYTDAPHRCRLAHWPTCSYTLQKYTICLVNSALPNSNLTRSFSYLFSQLLLSSHEPTEFAPNCRLQVGGGGEDGISRTPKAVAWTSSGLLCTTRILWSTPTVQLWTKKCPFCAFVASPNTALCPRRWSSQPTNQPHHSGYHPRHKGVSWMALGVACLPTLTTETTPSS